MKDIVQESIFDVRGEDGWRRTIPGMKSLRICWN
jgi:hypothetical protein